MKKPRYGIDAPNIILSFILGGLVAISLSALLFHFSWLVSFCFLLMGVVFLTEGIWMIMSSLKGKFIAADTVISHLNLKGNEKILDMGCGRGLLMIRAAKQLKEGKAYGIDIWRRQDLSNNQAEKALKNIQLEGVEGRAEILNGDMRELPFDDILFDCVVASLAIHNIKEKSGREKALREINRVLKPGGKAVILDFQKINEYAQFFESGYQLDVHPKQWSMFPPTRILVATKNL